MQLFYNSAIDTTSKSFYFDREESKHIVKVLRKKDNDILYVTNGLGQLFTTKIVLGSDSKCIVEILNVETANKPNYQLHLAVAPTKMNDRFEWFLEKAVEIGITEITPLICEHSERKHIKIDRFEKIILAALKQSNQLFLPVLNEQMTFIDFTKKEFVGQKFIAHCEDNFKKSLKSQLNPNENYTILIGPEGDFSSSEIKIAIEKSFVPVTLGNTRLRTETAALVACHSVAFSNEKDE